MVNLLDLIRRIRCSSQAPWMILSVHQSLDQRRIIGGLSALPMLGIHMRLLLGFMGFIVILRTHLARPYTLSESLFEVLVVMEVLDVCDRKKNGIGEVY